MLVAAVLLGGAALELEEELDLPDEDEDFDDEDDDDPDELLPLPVPATGTPVLLTSVTAAKSVVFPNTLLKADERES